MWEESNITEHVCEQMHKSGPSLQHFPSFHPGHFPSTFMTVYNSLDHFVEYQSKHTSPA